MQISGTWRNTSKSVCTAAIVVSPDPLPPTQPTYSAMKTPENTNGNPDDPEPADEGDI
jgi:hypothetical protein